MEASVVQQSENLALKLQISDSGERVKKAPKSIQHRASSKSTGQRRISTVSSEFPSRLTKPTISSSARSSNSLTVARRNSSGDLRDKSAALSGTKRQGSSSLTPGKKPTPSASDPGRRSLLVVRNTSSPSGESNPATKMSSSVTRKSLSVLPGARSLRTSTGSDLTKPETAKKIANRTASSVSSSAYSSRRVSSALLDSSGSSGSSKVRRTVSKFSSPTSRSPSVSSKSKTGSLSASSGKSSNLSGRKKATTPDSKDSSLIILPQVDDKASDEVHLRLEENPILQMPHLEAAPILLVGPTLKNFNERDPCQEEIAISKRYPAHTVSCIKDDWELCHPEHAVESTSCFLNEKWKNGLPPGYVLKESSMDRPFEGDACHCHFELVQDGIASIGSDLVLKYQWFIGEKTPTNFRAITNATSEVYWPNDEDIDRVLKVECIPVIKEIEFPSISAISSPVSAGTGIPKVLNLDVHGELVEGSHIKGYAQIAWCGGIPGKGVVSWLRKKWNSSPVVIVGAEDEEYQLTIDDLDSSLVFMYTPVTEDGVKGEPQYKYTDIVKAGPPTGHSLQLHGSMVEGQQLRFTASYSGGEKGNCLHEWFRVRCDGIKEKLSANDFLDLTLEDVGNSIEIVYMPVRNDGATGSSVSIISDVIAPALPEVSNVCVKELSSGVLTGKGDYFGGSEGLSLFSWYRENIQGTIVLISGATSKTYEVTDSDYNCHLLFGYMPVRSDSVVGELRLSEPTDIILPEVPKIELLTLTGEAVEGELLTAVEVIPESEIQQHVWSKYKGNIKYQWFISCGNGNVDMSFEPLSLQCSCSYQARCEDIGHFLKCECVVTDTFGRSSEPEYAKIGPVLPGIPKISKLEIEGRGFHTNLYAVHGIYNGGKEGNSKVQWLRSMVGCPDFIPIPGETGRMYEANVDDVGYRLVVVYTPIREDGLEGQPMLTSTEPIAVEPDVLEEVKQKMDLGALKFEVLCDTDQSPKMVSGIGSFERRILEINQKHVKVVKPGSKTSFPTTKIRGSYAPPFHVELFRNDQHRLRIVVDSENQVDLMVQTQHMRDIIVLVIRGLAQRFNSTSLNSLLKMGS